MIPSSSRPRASLRLHEALPDEYPCVDDAPLESLCAGLGPGVGGPDVLAHLLDHGEELLVLALGLGIESTAGDGNAAAKLMMREQEKDRCVV